MSLHLHRAERADRLVDALADVLAEPLPDPFASEVVCVPTRGVERWLAQRLSARLGTGPHGHDGICTGVWFGSLRRLMATATEPSDTQPTDEEESNQAGEQPDPWHPDRAVWPLLRVIDECRFELWAALLWSHLLGHRAHPAENPDSDPAPGGRRWRTARQLAELFAHYATSRPTMIDHWAAGRDLDAGGDALPPDLSWQAELWRRLRQRLDAASPPDRLRTALARLRDHPDAIALPPRLSVFGLTRLAPDHLQVLTTLGRHRDVHLWLPHPSPALWAATSAALDSTGARIGPRAEDDTVQLARHRLLAYLGRDSRELQLCLTAGTEVASDQHHAGGPPRPDTLLHRLQADLTANADPEQKPTPPPLQPGDGSVQVHATYGPDRQVEVLREILVGLLADDPTLEPRDIVVMCPDIERFAPLISAGFGLDTADDQAEHPGHRLRVRLADRSLRQLNPLLSVLSRVLDLADARITASELLDLAASGPVARKFGFSEDDLARLTGLVGESGVRWGLDAAHRRPYGLSEFGQNTWAAGLDRLLLGVAMDAGGDHFIGTALPLDDVDSSDVDLVGRLAELLSRVRRLVDAATAPRPLAEWARFGRTAIEALTATVGSDSWQVGHAYAELARLSEGAGDAEDLELGLGEVRALLADSFRGRASRANFRTGTLTVATMYPMRSVPHRVVCLLGVDDGSFPRRRRVVGDDLLARQEFVGDPDPRSEDRQLLLDAIMAAEDHLVIIYSGADARSGTERPPAVPVGELLDTLDRTVASPDDRPVRDHVVRRHPLQPFDAANFSADRSSDRQAQPFSFDAAALRGARSARGPRSEPPSAFGPEPLPPMSIGEVIDLPKLTAFFGHPARALLRTRANLALPDDPDDGTPPDQLPVSLTGLESWAIGDRLLQRHLRGADLGQLTAAEWRRGSLPPRRFGSEALDQVLTRVREVSERARPHLLGEPASLDVTCELEVADRSHLVVGTVQPVHATSLVRVGYGWLTAKQRLTSWVELLALSAAHPHQQWRAISIGRGATSVLGPVDPDWAGRVLADLLELYLGGLVEPVPFAPKTSAEYAELRARDRSVELYRPRLEKTWAMERDAVWARFLGPEAGLQALLDQPSRPAEERGTLLEPSRFGTLARRVFTPLFSHEDLS
jgi:exodeoxyribonuclease V gamma subunit